MLSGIAGKLLSAVRYCWQTVKCCPVLLANCSKFIFSLVSSFLSLSLCAFVHFWKGIYLCCSNSSGLTKRRLHSKPHSELECRSREMERSLVRSTGREVGYLFSESRLSVLIESYFGLALWYFCPNGEIFLIPNS